MREIRFVVPAKPMGKARHRMTKSGRAYPDKKSQNRENLIAVLCRQAMMRANDNTVSKSPIRLEFEAITAPPKSWPSWKRELAWQEHLQNTAKPDLDNIEKLIKDALNGIAWVDDAQVIQVVKSKRYGTEDRTIIVIHELSGFPSQVKKKDDLACFITEPKRLDSKTLRIGGK